MKRRQRMTRSPDRRSRRTREALLRAFFGLVLAHPFEKLSVAQISARAGVGRSTFYEHFRGKNELLAASLAGPFGVLADTLGVQDNTAVLTRQLEHFWENRAVGRNLFTGPMRRHVMAVLEQLIRQRLRARRASAALLTLPVSLAAAQIAANLLTPIAAWLTDAPACPAPRLAASLRRTSQALAAALGWDAGEAEGRARPAPPVTLKRAPRHSTGVPR